MSKIAQTSQDIIANATAGTSIGAFGVAWLPIMTDVATFVALLVSIAAGVAAYRYHTKRLRALDNKKD